ncbi:hypothetical protein [Streptomyces microflavus]|uniref:hypothetical protein n=1 Tax=Streptomyces microflavus TaxID=1919 RepID=UPI003674A578
MGIENENAVDPRQLVADEFTESDLARIELVGSAASGARRLVQYAQTVCEDQAQAGDYVRLATILDANDSLLRSAVVAERVRGTSWETLAEVLGMSAEEVENRWSDAVARMRRETPATSVVRKDPGYWAAEADRFVTSGKPGLFSAASPPLSASLDAAAHLTGRDAAAADRAFSGSPVCPSCTR